MKIIVIIAYVLNTFVQVIYIECVSIGRGLAFGEDTFFSQVI